MSHVFISYAHEDVDQRDALAAKLDEAGISYWYDKHITGGRDWRDEIDTVLKEAYALVVIVTPKSMDSHAVTYEWAWAIGNGLPVIALFFDNETKTKIHHALARKQWITCYEGIPDLLVETLKEHEETPPDVEYLSLLIIEALMPFRIRACVVFWLYPYYQAGVIFGPKYVQIINSLLDEARELHSKQLPQLKLSYSHAFSSKQTGICRELMRSLLSFWLVFNVPIGGSYYVLGEITSSVNEAQGIWNDKLEPLICFFETGTHYDAAYKVFDNVLRGISKERLKESDLPFVPISEDTILGWFLPEDEQEIIRQAIQDVRSYESLARKRQT